MRKRNLRQHLHSTLAHHGVDDHLHPNQLHQLIDDLEDLHPSPGESAYDFTLQANRINFGGHQLIINTDDISNKDSLDILAAAAAAIITEMTDDHGQQVITTAILAARTHSLMCDDEHNEEGEL